MTSHESLPGWPLVCLAVRPVDAQSCGLSFKDTVDEGDLATSFKLHYLPNFSYICNLLNFAFLVPFWLRGILGDHLSTLMEK